MEDRQCELLLECSYLKICKISHLLHTVPLIKPRTSYKYLMMAYVKPLRGHYIALCLKDRVRIHSSLPYDLEALGSFPLLALPCCLSGKLPYLPSSSAAVTQQSWSCDL